MITIFRAVKRNFLTQGFYDNLNPIYKQNGMKWHGAWDWALNNGDPIYYDCSVEGYVLNTEIDDAGGLGINIITESDGLILKHRYWHLKSFNVVAGQKVKAGALLGFGDTTGYSTGPHLHRDAKEMIRKNGALEIKDRSNGSFGTIDYSQYFKNYFILDFISDLKTAISLSQRLLDLYQQLKIKLFG